MIIPRDHCIISTIPRAFSFACLITNYQHLLQCCHTNSRFGTKGLMSARAKIVKYLFTFYLVPICVLQHTQDMNTTLSVIAKSDKYNNESIYAVGDEIQFHCMTGYRRLEGNTSLTCNETGHWNGQPLRCEGNIYQCMILANRLPCQINSCNIL
jgi:hypothetical protein